MITLCSMIMEVDQLASGTSFDLKQTILSSNLNTPIAIKMKEAAKNDK